MISISSPLPLSFSPPPLSLLSLSSLSLSVSLCLSSLSLLIQLAIEELIAKLVEPQEDDDGGRVASPDVIKECALHVLVQSCQSVISKVSKIATQLLYGRSHLVRQ